MSFGITDALKTLEKSSEKIEELIKNQQYTNRLIEIWLLKSDLTNQEELDSIKKELNL